jgi:hypothetical protein
MDIFIRNIPIQCTNNQLNDFLKVPLNRISVHSFHCQKMKGKGCAILTIADKSLAEVFLQLHGSLPNARPRQRSSGSLLFQGRVLICVKSVNEPDALLLKHMALEANKLKVSQATPGRRQIGHSNDATLRMFATQGVQCGRWDYDTGALAFVSHFQDMRAGTIIFRRKAVIIILKVDSTEVARLEIPLDSIDHFVLGTYANPTLTLSLKFAPKVFRRNDAELLRAFGSLSLTTSAKKKREPPLIRISSLGLDHDEAVATCLVYQTVLCDRFSLEGVYHLMQREEYMPPSIKWPTPTHRSGEPISAARRHLDKAIADFNRYPWPMGFQIQKLATDGYLHPAKVTALLPKIDESLAAYGPIAAAEALRYLSLKIPVAGPEAEAKSFNVRELGKALLEAAASFCIPGSMYDIAKRHEHIALVHKATVTPAGTYLEGPEPEVKNRVLRRYKNHSDYFIRVTFSDEDGEAVRFDPLASLDEIFYTRFRSVLDSGVQIAGRRYIFLGFSHSSLRSQTCWFMAPFVHGEELIHAKEVVRGLGDFSQIRSPARCAARIGQAFSDTICAVPVRPSVVQIVDDVERNGRCFSDGCGTISLSLLKKVWLKYAIGQDLKPTILQIRFAGAKGVLSLDSRLKGDQLCLKPSMLKFKGANTWDIEICGAALKTLPMYLNRQFIKIMEDLGVRDDVLLRLQAAEVERLRRITLSPVNAATFLELSHTGTAAKIPALIRHLNDIGLEFQRDPFLQHFVELAAMISLRELKYRSRIPVEHAFTLYGIMDETGFLKEGEVYVVVRRTSDGGREVLKRGKVAVTRAPAMFPGDIQFARAVDVPHNSPLNSLHNCIVFSSQGERDLPSCLSGGDLDGDLYNVNSPLIQGMTRS